MLVVPLFLLCQDFERVLWRWAGQGPFQRIGIFVPWVVLRYLGPTAQGVGDDSEEELEILESKLLSAREMLYKNVGVIEHELTRRKKVENKK